MATTITNVAALTAIVEFATDNGFADAEILDKVEKHIAQLSKPSKKSGGPTKEQMRNSLMLNALVAHMRATGASYTVKEAAAWLSENYEGAGLVSTQKATALLTKAVKDGTANRSTDGKRITFTVTA